MIRLIIYFMARKSCHYPLPIVITITISTRSHKPYIVLPMASSSCNPDHMPWSGLKWTGNEPGVTRIKDMSNKLADEQLQKLNHLQQTVKDWEKQQQVQQERIEDLMKEIKKRDEVISCQKKLIDSLRSLLPQ